MPCCHGLASSQATERSPSVRPRVKGAAIAMLANERPQTDHNPMPVTRLQQAFETLMEHAPSALFKKARALYLCKYPLDGRDSSSALRLFIAQEAIEEQVVGGGSEGERLGVLSIKPVTMALVHWQQAKPASAEAVKDYFQQQWGIDPPELSHQSDAWFREGGHQSLFNPPEGLIWVRSSPMPDQRNESQPQ